MRIVWVSPHCWPDYVLRDDGLGQKSQGGQTVVMYHGTRALADANPDLQVDIYARYEDGEPQGVDIHPRVKVIRLPLGPKDRYFPKEEFWGAPIDGFVDEIVRYAAQHDLRYDLVHGHYADGWHVAHLLWKQWGTPYLCATHSLGIRKRDNALRMGEGTPEELEKKYNFSRRIASERPALASAHRLTPLTVEEGEYMIEQYGVDRSKIRTINNGVALDEFYPPDLNKAAEVRDRLGLGPDDLPILLVARVDPRKGQKQLIEAAPAVIRRVKEGSGKNVKLLFVAWVESGYARTLEARVEELGIRDSVIYHPPVLNKEIAPYFWTSSVYSLSSTYDIFPIVMLEAMGSGLPIVATENGGPREILTSGENGYLVDPTNPAELADALVRVLENEDERQRLGRNAHRLVVERYTWPRIAEETMKVYQELLKEQGQR
jgi:glycosyltransferase involved in cell wall biosynthesis